MTASFLYNPELVNRSVNFQPDRYFYFYPLVSYEVNIGAITATGTNGRSEVTNNYTDSLDRFWDRFILQDSNGNDPVIPVLESLFDINALAVGMTFYDYTDANALSSALSPENIDLDSFDRGRSYVTIQMELAGGTFNWIPMFARISSAEIVSVPSPGSLGFFFLGAT